MIVIQDLWGFVIQMSGKVFSFRLPVGLVEELDAARGDESRNSFVSGVLGKRLGWEPEEKKTDSVVPRKDDEVLLSFIGDGSVSLRKAGEDLDWPEMRVEKAANKLANAGLIKFVGAGMVERK